MENISVEGHKILEEKIDHTKKPAPSNQQILGSRIELRSVFYYIFSNVVS